MPEPLLPADAVVAALHWRYATKKFDASRRLSADEWARFETVLDLSPSSYGMQPYRFVVVTDPALRQTLRAVAYDQSQLTDCSHLVVFAARLDVTEADVDHYLDRVVEVRGVDRAHLGESFGKTMKHDLVLGPRHAVIQEWAARQAYIALGNLLTCAAIVGVDACPMEGFDNARFDEILGLTEQGYRAVVLAAVGHRAPDDGAASLPKVRFPEAELIVRR